MQSNKLTGLALIVGALVLIVAIVLHPRHGTNHSSEDMTRQNLVVIVLVLTSFGVLGVGFLHLSRLTARPPWSEIALVALAMAGISSSLAGITGHLIVPRLVAEVKAADNLDQAAFDMILRNDRILNVALTQTSFAAWAIGMLALSISMLYSSPGWKVVGAVGIALGLCILLALTFGQLQISLHGVGLVVLGSGIWLIAIGSGLCANSSFAELPPRQMG